jgi:hypothetical protein
VVSDEDELTSNGTKGNIKKNFIEQKVLSRKDEKGKRCKSVTAPVTVSSTKTWMPLGKPEKAGE